MKTLQQLKALGVTHLSVTNEEATAVNPYEDFTNLCECDREYLCPNHELYYEVQTLPPLPCPAVENGTYEIGDFKEESEWLDEEKSEWVIDTSPHIGGNCLRTRKILVLKEQVEETEPMREGERLNDYVSRKAHSTDKFYAEKRKAEQLAEKPEGESELIDKNKLIAKIENVIPEFRALHGDKMAFGMYTAIELIQTTKSSPPKAEPVASAEEWLQSNIDFDHTGWTEIYISELADRLEKYTSLRVAQEKAELIEKLEGGHLGMGVNEDRWYGMNKAIDIIKNS